MDNGISAQSLDRDSIAVGLTRLPSLDAGQDRLPPRGGLSTVIRVEVGIVGMTVMLKVSEPCNLEREHKRNSRDIPDQLIEPPQSISGSSEVRMLRFMRGQVRKNDVHGRN